MRRPTLRTAAGMLALGAIGLAAPTAATLVSAATTNAPAITSQTPDTTAPSTDPGTANQAPGPGAPGRHREPKIGTIDPAQRAAYEACLTEHGVTVPKPPQQPAAGDQGQAGQRQSGQDPAVGQGAGPDTNHVGPPPGRPPMDDATKAAFEACKDLRPKVTFTDEELAKIRAFEACLKENGVDIPPFDPNAEPDKDATKPQVDPATMHKAQEACKDLNPFGGPGGPGGPGRPGGPGGPGGGCMIPGQGGQGGQTGPGVPGQGQPPANGDGSTTTPPATGSATTS